MKLERRLWADTELRVVSENGATRATGYAARYGMLSRDLGGFREMIQPGTFSRALREKQDVSALINHDPNRLMARTSSGTLTLNEDEKGLRFDFTLPDTTYARDLAEMMKRGDMTKCSFAFRTVTDQWRKVDGQVVRELQDVDLFDVSIVTEPAYPDTEASLRMIDAERVAEQVRLLSVTGTPNLDEARLRLAVL